MGTDMKTPDFLVDVSIATGSYPGCELEISLARSLRNGPLRDLGADFARHKGK